MKDTAITRDELVEQMIALGNKPVVWLGTGLVMDAVRAVRLVRAPLGEVIGLIPASTQDNVGDVPTTAMLRATREDLRTAMNRFTNTFESYVSGNITANDFRIIKRDYDTVIARCLGALENL